MSDPKYKHNDVVWCKFAGLFWPGEVRGLDSLPEEIREGFLKTPKVVVKFFDEEGYEFVLNDKDIFPYNCDRKEEFIQKGIARSRRKAKEGATGGWFAKFPKDVVYCEKLTRGNLNILNEEPFAVKKEKKVDYSLIFGDPEEIEIKREELSQKSSGKKGRPRHEQDGTNGFTSTPKPITHPRFIGRSDYKVRILTQPSTPYHIDTNDKSPSQPLPPKYNCHLCDFAATRLNVIVLHNKSHSAPNRTNLANHERPKVSAESQGNKTFSDAKIATSAKKRDRLSSPKISLESSSKRPRLNKKQREEKKEVIREREDKKKAIFGDWSEDENEEEEEKVKIKETIENAVSIDSSQDSDSEDLITEDDFFSNTDDHHSVDSDDDFIITKSKNEKESLSACIASTKPLRKRKVVLDSFIREQENTKSKKKVGEKSKIRAMRNKKTESAADAVNSLIKSKLQPNKTYVSSGRPRLNSNTEIVDVLRKTPVKNTNMDHNQLRPKRLKPENRSESKLDISQVLSETTLPEIPSLPDEKEKMNTKTNSNDKKDAFESNFSSSDSGAQEGSSAEEPSSPPVSPPPTTPSKKPGIMRKSSTRSIQLPTRPNGNSQLIRHESGGTKYAMISAKAKAKQLARTQMAKDEFLARNEVSAAQDLLGISIGSSNVKQESIDIIELNTAPNQFEKSPEKVTNKTLENTDRIGDLSEKLDKDSNLNGENKNVSDEKQTINEMKSVKMEVMNKNDVDIDTGEKEFCKAEIKSLIKEEDATIPVEEIKQKSQKTIEVTQAKSNEKNSIENSQEIPKAVASEFDFTDDQSKLSISNLSSSRKKLSSENAEIESCIISSTPKSTTQMSQPKISENKTNISFPTPQKTDTHTVPQTSSDKTVISPVKSSIGSPQIIKNDNVIYEMLPSTVQKISPVSNIVQRVSESIATKPPSMVVIKPASVAPKPKTMVVQTQIAASPSKPTVKIVSSNALTVSAKPTVVTTKLVSKPTVTVVSKPTMTTVNKSMVPVYSKPSVAVNKPSLIGFGKPTVTLVGKPQALAVNKPVVIADKKPTVTIISKPSKISIEKPAQYEISVPLTKNVNSGLTISKPVFEPAKKPVLATVSKLTIEPVMKPSAVMQKKTLVSDMNKPVVAGVNKMSESFLSKSVVSTVSKQIISQQPSSTSTKPVLLPNSTPSISSMSKPSLSQLKMGTKVVTLSQKQDSSTLSSPDTPPSIMQTIGTNMLLSPTKGIEKPLTVSLEPKKMASASVERSKPIVKTVELPKRAAEFAAALKPSTSPTKPIVFMESSEKKGKAPTSVIELDNSPVSEFLVAVNDTMIDSNVTKQSGTVLSHNDLVVPSENKMTASNNILLPAGVGSEGLTAVNLSTGGYQFVGDQTLAGSDSDGELIYLLVDDGTDPNLENQTLYIDPSQLAAATGGMILQNDSGSGPLLLQTSGDRGQVMLQTSVGGGSVLIQGNDGPVILQAHASDAGQMLIQNADGQVVLQDNGALSNVVIVEDKDASSALHGLVTSADTTGGVATLPAHPSSSLLAQVPLITTPSQQGPIMVSSTRKDEQN